MRTYQTHHHMLAELAQQYDHPDTIAIELGVYQGATIRTIRQHFTGNIHGFDTFTGLPEHWRDGYGIGTFATEPPHIPDVTLHIGLFQHTLQPFLNTLTQPIRLTHIDCDLYSSTIYTLTHITPHLDNESVIIFDEYDNYPDYQHHEHKAFNEWLTNNPHITATLIGRVGQPDAQQAAFHLQHGTAPAAPTT